MKFSFFILLLSLSFSTIAKDGVLFKTTAGDLLFELDYENAPKTSRYFANLASSSLFEGIRIIYLNREIGLRTEFIEDTSKTNGTNYEDFIFPQEFESTGLKNVRGALNLTTNSDNPKGTSSFGLMFSSLPAIDGYRTVFGRLIRGEEILDHLRSYPVDYQMQPLPELRIISTKLIAKSQFNTIKLNIIKDRRQVGLTEKMDQDQKSLFYILAIFWIILVGLFFAPVPKIAKTIVLTILLVTSFLLLGVIGPSLEDTQMAGIVILLMGLATFRLMGNYE